MIEPILHFAAVSGRFSMFVGVYKNPQRSSARLFDDCPNRLAFAGAHLEFFKAVVCNWGQFLFPSSHIVGT
jgi:hypothetical protein